MGERLRPSVVVAAVALAVAPLAACTGDDVSTTPVPTTASGATLCSGSIAQADLETVAGQKDLTQDSPTLLFYDDPRVVSGYVCRVHGEDGFLFQLRLTNTSDPKVLAHALAVTRESLDTGQSPGQIRYPESVGVGVAGPGSGADESNSNLYVGSMQVDVDLQHGPEKRDGTADVIALTKQAIAAWGLTTDPKAPGPTAAPKP